MRTLAILAALLAPAAAWAQDDVGPIVGGMETMVQAASAKAEAYTVGIWVTRSQPAPTPVAPTDALSPFRKRPTKSPASGTIIESDGFILTSYFNVNHKPTSIKVVLPNGREHEAKLVGYHEPADVALLKIDDVELPVPERSPLAKLKVGAPVLALGRGPDAHGLTIAPGVVSAHLRMDGRCVQTDAKMNYGNTGGPLLDSEGRLIGVSCRVTDREFWRTGQNSGIGFALTHDQIDRLLPDLKKGARVQREVRPFMGIQANQEESADDGVLIGQVIPGGSAEAAGIKAGDVILEFGDVRTLKFDDLKLAILKKQVGDAVTVKLRRGTEEKTIDLVLGESPNE